MCVLLIFRKIINAETVMFAVIQLIRGASIAVIKQCRNLYILRFLYVAGHSKKIPKRRAPKNNADWCNRFVQNSHGEPIGDKNDSWAITAETVMGCCNLN